MAVVFLDLDGTILNSGRPAEGVVDAIAMLKKNGHLPVIATGRVPCLFEGLRKELGIEDYVSANGNYIYYKQKVVYERYIPKSVSERMMKSADCIGFDLAVEGVEGFKAYRKKTDLVGLFSHVFHIEEPKLDQTYALNSDLLAFVLFEDWAVDEIKYMFPELVFNRSNRFGYDVNLSGGLKINGIKFLINYLGLPEDDIYAFGDGYNDIDMLAGVKNSVAMGNAFPEVKTVARYVTDRVDERGVEKALRRFNLI
ncbi:MAG TPA: Cof-type HAD-IIB family hydrolase [Bacillota bacterium]|nr:Cof-type HAD-IIB family hydrolase [Bacillota bacterium]HPF42308.1 Cof-type HAD-IIB family hydrolase [Bacillota bacterium]HPJ86176.1 Cof-type HAD-IIB family hydrolase [Bacillota bacterium]HPQ61887.1 Cof-type HAD-IIB family hydrolase [Bacillota bacterium]HRX91366.1 Cof-type HAD-IIB family hydrolase [Candidatus Izemoplasmatales bacterium]